MRNRLLVVWLCDTGCRLSEALSVPVASVEAGPVRPRCAAKRSAPGWCPPGAALRRVVTRFLPKQPLCMHAQRREDPGALVFDAKEPP